VSFELLEAQPRACRVDLDAAPSASALPAHAGTAGALANGVAAANVWPFPRGVATFVRPGSGRIEPIARPAAPANTNTVILRTTSPAQLMAGYDSTARDLKDRSKRLTNNYGIRRYKIKLLCKAIVSHDPSNATDRSRDVGICVERARHLIRRTVSLATFKRMKPMRSKVHRSYAEAHDACTLCGNYNISSINVCIMALNLTQPCELGDARIKRAVRQAPHVHITKRRAATKHHPPRVIQPSSNVANVHRQAHYHACVRKKQFASQYRHATSRRCKYKTRSLNPSLLVRGSRRSRSPIGNRGQSTPSAAFEYLLRRPLSRRIWRHRCVQRGGNQDLEQRRSAGAGASDVCLPFVDLALRFRVLVATGQQVLANWLHRRQNLAATLPLPDPPQGE